METSLKPIKWHEKKEFDEKRNKIHQILKKRGIRLHSIHIKAIDEYTASYDVKIEGWLEIDKKMLNKNKIDILNAISEIFEFDEHIEQL